MLEVVCSRGSAIDHTVVGGVRLYAKLVWTCAGPAFYRAESAQARDLAVLALRVQQKTQGYITVPIHAGQLGAA